MQIIMNVRRTSRIESTDQRRPQLRCDIARRRAGAEHVFRVRHRDIRIEQDDAEETANGAMHGHGFDW
jgi:hypothetical protein